MIFTVDHDRLVIALELEDTDEPGLDLTRDGLGHQLLTIAAQEMQAGANRQRSPGGVPWARLKASTEAQKGHNLIGLRSGAMVEDLAAGWTEVTPRSATWGYPTGATFGRAHGFHNGRQDPRNGNQTQPPRPLIGWTDEAKALARQILRR